MKISILIPTCNRPEFLAECLESCTNQTYKPYEILIGDDSLNSESETVVRSFAERANVRYFKNASPLGQAENINLLINESNSELLCLIHDDDKLALDALDKLKEIFKISKNTIIAFGKQYVISDNGELDEQASFNLNTAYYRTPDRSGIQSDIVKSALLQQIPNNGFLVRSECAKKIGYSKAGEKYGDACDFGFALELALAYENSKAFFLDEYTAFYRLSNVSILRNKSLNNVAYSCFINLYQLAKLRYQSDQDINQQLEYKSPAAIGNAIQLGKIKDAKEWFFSRYHRKKIASLGGVKRLFLLVIGLLRSR